jgi:formylglycine-generating enzyme required for sulfatase activity
MGAVLNFVLKGSVMNKVITCLVLGLFVAGSSPATAVSSQISRPPNLNKVKVPEEATVKKVTQEVSLLIKNTFQPAVTAAQNDKLAKQLIQLADETDDDLPGKYVLLKFALERAVSSNNLGLGLTAIQQIDRTFVVDRHGLTLAFLRKLANSNTNTIVVQSIVDHCLSSQIELITKDEQLVRYITQYRDVALSVLEPKKAMKEITRVKERSTYAQTIARAFLDLKADPNNGKANQLVGLHLLTNHQTPDAIRHFQKSDKKLFRHAADLEQKHPMSFEAEIELAEAWLQTENPYAGSRADLWLSRASSRLSDFSGLTLIRNKALLTDLQTRVGELLPWVESITNTIGMKLKLIPAGTFRMGSLVTEGGRGRDEHQHRVTISKAFYMQTTEVTQGQWKEVMGTKPWIGQGVSIYVKEGPNYPAQGISWDDAVAYCKKLSEREGKTYRLPTEAEWEYACRAGTKTTWSFGDDEKVLGDYANLSRHIQSRPRTIPSRSPRQVGIKKPNAFGLYDMHGNVWEWCHDYYGEDYYKQSPERDPQGPARGSPRVCRGGSWFHDTRDSRSASRDWVFGNIRVSGGFRLVRVLE